MPQSTPIPCNSFVKEIADEPFEKAYPDKYDGSVYWVFLDGDWKKLKKLGAGGSGSQQTDSGANRGGSAA